MYQALIYPQIITIIPRDTTIPKTQLNPLDTSCSVNNTWTSVGTAVGDGEAIAKLHPYLLFEGQSTLHKPSQYNSRLPQEYLSQWMVQASFSWQ